MPSIEELRQRKEQMELEAQIAKLQKQKDRREAVEKYTDKYQTDDKFRNGVILACVVAGVWLLALTL